MIRHCRPVCNLDDFHILIAHLPSGYILGSLARGRGREGLGAMVAAMVGSVVPDIDMLYFHCVDGGRTHHHDYITHWPLFWFAIGLTSLVAGRLLGWSNLPAIGLFFAGAMLHMLLDTVASPIMWLMPFDRQAFELVTVPAAYRSWVLSFMLHWTFGFEILICAFALWLALRQSSRRTTVPQNGT